MRSSIIPILGLPLGLLFSILPSSTSFNNPSPLTTCHIQFFFRLTIVSTILLLSTTASSTSSLLILSSQLTFSNIILTLRHDTSHNTRSSDSQNFLSVPKINSERGRGSFLYAAPTIWNSLPDSLCASVSVSSFLSGQKTHLFPP